MNEAKAVKISQIVIRATEAMKRQTTPRTPFKPPFTTADGQIVGTITNDKLKHLYNLIEEISAELNTVQTDFLNKLKASKNGRYIEAEMRAARAQFLDKLDELERTTDIFAKLLFTSGITLSKGICPVILENWQVIAVDLKVAMKFCQGDNKFPY